MLRHFPVQNFNEENPSVSQKEFAGAVQSRELDGEKP
jgi:hypothetical protein